MGAERALVVHGTGGLDEFAPAGPTFVAELGILAGQVSSYQLCPADFGLAEASLADLKGGAPARNATMLLETLRGKPGASRVAALMTAAAGLRVVEEAELARSRSACRRRARWRPGHGPARAPARLGPAADELMILDDILAEKRSAVSSARLRTPLAEIEARAAAMAPARSFLAGLRSASGIAWYRRVQAPFAVQGLDKPRRGRGRGRGCLSAWRRIGYLGLDGHALFWRRAG